VERVRPATDGDLAECAALLDRAREEVAGQRGAAALLGSGSASVEACWAEGPSRRLLVGEFEGATVGLATGHLGDRGRGMVDCCYVVPEARRVGVGGALVEALTAWFADAGCSGVDALALPGDRDTKQLYETAGFRARLLVLHRPLR
jgi:GNAT superfamily N-acetyltransferase